VRRGRRIRWKMGRRGRGYGWNGKGWGVVEGHQEHAFIFIGS